MINIQDYVSIGANGELQIDNEKFASAYQSEMDRARTQASDTASANAEKKLRTQLEKELRKEAEEKAKLSAEELLKQREDELLKKQRAFEEKQLKAMYKENGFGDEEIELLCSFIGEDSDANLETATKFINARKAQMDLVITKTKEEMQFNGYRPQGGGTDQTLSIGQRQAQRQNAENIDNFVDLSSYGGQPQK